MAYPAYLNQLILALRILPGVGGKTAERYAFQLLQLPDPRLKELGALISQLKEQLEFCQDCGALCDQKGCSICQSSSRDNEKLCLVQSPKEILSLEATQEYNGHYYVLPHLISPIEGRGIESLPIEQIQRRMEKLGTSELIIALDSTLEGDATTLYLKQILQSDKVKTTRLAFGIPMGSSLDFVDGGTLARAFSDRQHF